MMNNLVGGHLKERKFATILFFLGSGFTAIWCIDSEESESERCEKTRELTSRMTIDAFGAHHTIANGFIVGRVDPCSLVRREPSTDCDFVKESVVASTYH